ncbi:MAG: 50S ribosomal protein L14e [Promethearchaeota archaeon]
MGVFEVGRVCVKLTGREAGRYAVIVEVIDKNYALVDGPRIRRRRCNFNHLEPTSDMLDIPKGADGKSVIAAAKEKKLAKKLEGKVEITP